MSRHSIHALRASSFCCDDDEEDDVDEEEEEEEPVGKWFFISYIRLK